MAHFRFPQRNKMFAGYEAVLHFKNIAMDAMCIHGVYNPTNITGGRTTLYLANWTNQTCPCPAKRNVFITHWGEATSSSFLNNLTHDEDLTTIYQDMFEMFFSIWLNKKKSLRAISCACSVCHSWREKTQVHRWSQQKQKSSTIKLLCMVGPVVDMWKRA